MFRKDYSWIRFLEKSIAENGFGDIEKANVLLAKEKRKLRARLRVVEKKGMFEEIANCLVNEWSKDESYHAKYFFPDEHWTEEEKAEFKDAFWIERPYSAYDCTGAIFTNFIDIFDVPKGTLVYIWMSRDV